MCNGFTSLLLLVATSEALRAGTAEGRASLENRPSCIVLSILVLCAAVEVMLLASDVDETDDTWLPTSPGQSLVRSFVS